MKQIRKNTESYLRDGIGITKRVKSLQGNSAMNFFEKRSFTSVVRAFSLVLIFCAVNRVSYSQNCSTSGTFSQSANENTYYPGTQATVSVGATSITLGAVPSGYGTTAIATGDIVLIIQMQGAQANYSSSQTNSTYGSGTSGWGSGFTSTNLMAGTMEFAVASNAVATTGGTLNLVTGTVKSYSYSAFGTYGQYTYQVIRVPNHYNIKLMATISTPSWNGSVGGVTVIDAINQLNFNGNTISAAGAGFRGGAGMSLSGESGAPGTAKNYYYTMSTYHANASKGEGIAGTPRYVNYNNAKVDNTVEGYPNGSFARGAPGNAGGGATDSNPVSNDQNAGGGGGGNGGVGGLGGNGWYSFGYTGGKGGAAFSSTIGSSTPTYSSPSRLIMGGGGGAGTSNNSTGTPGGGFASSGAAGGGIVIISALSITGTGTITVAGSTANGTVINDASGGGGAGGSILIYANSGHSGVTAIANGGDGGTNTPSGAGAGTTQHGPGGGGGGGVVYSNATLNAASTVAAGVAGKSRALIVNTPPDSSFGAFPGDNGILTQTFPFSQLPPKMQVCQSAILPVNILDFSVSYVASDDVQVIWATSNEVNSDYFEVQRSFDGNNFTPVGQVNASHSSDLEHNYSYNDYLGSVNSSIVYYRLRIVDMTGKFTYSKIVSLRLGQPETKISVYPNPADDHAMLSLYSEKQTTAMMRLMDNSGKQIIYKTFAVNTGNNSIMIDQLGSLPRGIYIVQVIYDNTMYNQKLVKR